MPSSKREPLSTEALRAALLTLPGWRHEDDSLVRRFELRGFREAMAFLVRIAFEAEQRGHHPEIANVYGRVDLRLRTHDAGNRVTQLDVELARAIDDVARS
jgi:4a-hydroxytetrahydrobiopterin dehydratase